MRRRCAVVLLVLGESVVAALSLVVAAVPALLAFLGAAVLLARAEAHVPVGEDASLRGGRR